MHTHTLASGGTSSLSRLVIQNLLHEKLKFRQRVCGETLALIVSPGIHRCFCGSKVRTFCADSFAIELVQNQCTPMCSSYPLHNMVICRSPSKILPRISTEHVYAFHSFMYVCGYTINLTFKIMYFFFSLSPVQVDDKVKCKVEYQSLYACKNIDWSNWCIERVKTQVNKYKRYHSINPHTSRLEKTEAPHRIQGIRILFFRLYAILIRNQFIAQLLKELLKLSHPSIITTRISNKIELESSKTSSFTTFVQSSTMPKKGHRSSGVASPSLPTAQARKGGQESSQVVGGITGSDALKPRHFAHFTLVCEIRRLELPSQ